MSVTGEEQILSNLLKHKNYIEKNSRKAVRNGAEAFRETLVKNTPISKSDKEMSDKEHLFRHTKKGNLKAATGEFQQDVGYDKEIGWRAHFPNSGTVKQKPQHFVEKSREQAKSEVQKEFIKALKI